MKKLALIAFALTFVYSSHPGLFANRCYGSASAVELKNLAPKAQVSASSEHSAPHAARAAVDGRIPGSGARRDAGSAWAIDGARAEGVASFTLEWAEPVAVGAVVYWGRTAWHDDEGFKDYEIYVDGSEEPVARGAFEQRHGPQVVRLAEPVTAQSLELRFLSSYGGTNPGAAEIAVYPSAPSDEQLSRFPHGPDSPAAHLRSGRLGFRELAVVKRQQLNTSHVYTYHAEGFRPGGGLYVATIDERGNTSLRQLVDASEGMILGCDVSYDGTEILFSWKRKAAPIESHAFSLLPDEHCRQDPEATYQVFRIGVDGTGLTQLTDGPHHNLDATWLPDGGIAFLSDRTPAYAYCFVTTSPVLFRMERDGSNQRQLSFNYLMDFTPSVMPDGRILFTRWEYVDRPAIPIQSLWTINPDGTGLAGYFGNRVLDPGTFMQAQPIPGTRKVLSLLTSHNGSPRGAVGVIDISHGAHVQEGIFNLTPEVDIGRVDQGNGNGPGNRLVNRGPYESPYPLDDQCWLVSNAGVIELRTYDPDDTPVSVLENPGGMGFYYPRPIMPREKQPVIASVLPEDPPPYATVIMTDVYNGLEGYVERGKIKQIAVVEELPKNTFTPQVKYEPGRGYVSNIAFGFQFPVVSSGATYAPKRVLGYAQVSDEGSASFRVPSSLPVHFMPLDEHGRALQRMRTFTHFMPGERQSCIGCHGDRNYTAPPPPPAAQRAAQAKVQDLQPPDWGVKGFSYREVVQPVVDMHCTQCHNAHSPAGNVDLSGDMTDFFNVSYEILARQGTVFEQRFNTPEVRIGSGAEGRNPYTSWISTINGAEYNIRMINPKTWGSPASKLADLVLSGHPDEEGHPRVQVDESGIRRIMAWIDLNVPYYPNSDATYADSPGNRRLYPQQLDRVIEEVATNRCISCHVQGVPRDFYTRIEKPELNSFLLAPLAKEAGGTEACGRAVFESTADPDYRAILETFKPIHEIMRTHPREDTL